jgi:hypothetical protein
LRLDAKGEFWHEGAKVTHPGFRGALLRWLDVLPDGRPILRLDDERYAYLDVDDAMLLVSSLRWEGGHAILTLNDGSSEELRYETLEQTPANVVYCKVRNGKLRARFTTAAYYQLAEHVEEGSDGFVLRCAAGELPIQPSTAG